MILTLDIETARDEALYDELPEPKPDSRLKDPVKIEDSIVKKRMECMDKMPLNPLFSRMCTYAIYRDNESSEVFTMSEISHQNEVDFIVKIFENIDSDPTNRLVTWNGNGFDLPYLYMRTVILNTQGANIKPARPLGYWTKRYQTIPHCDLMAVIANWNGFAALDTYAKKLLGEKKLDIDVSNNHQLIKDDCAELISERCLKDVRLTYNIYKKCEGILF